MNEAMTERRNRVLVVGASGLVGTAAANSFLDAGWSVVTASRRAPSYVAVAGREDRWTHVALDLRDRAGCDAALRALPPISHVVYCAVFELPGLMAGWQDPVQIETNGAMFEHLLDPLLARGTLRHVTLLQGTKAYGAAVRPMRVPARERHARVPHPNFYWLQEDVLRARAATHGVAFTILRPQLIVGPNHGVVMNLPPVLGAYAALRRAEGCPFSFPGGADWVWEAVDVRLVGDACCWAATAPQAAGETFNLTNGEVFLWRDLWPALAEALGVEPGADEPQSLAAYFEQRSDAWAALARQHRLREPSLAALLGESHYYADLCFASGAATAPPPALVSSIKIKQAGFTATWDTEESFCHWLRELQRRRLIPSS